MTAQDVYSATVSALPASERLKLATMILEGLSDTAAVLDYSDQWSDQDVQDVASFSAQHALSSFRED